MKDEQKSPDQPRPQEPRLPYEKPQVISDEVFETLALSCANARFVCPPGSGNRS